MFIETSAKAGVNIKNLFKDLAQSLPGMESTGGKGGDNPGATKDDKSGEDPATKFKLDKQGQPGQEDSSKTNTAKNDCSC